MNYESVIKSIYTQQTNTTHSSFFLHFAAHFLSIFLHLAAHFLSIFLAQANDCEAKPRMQIRFCLSHRLTQQLSRTRASASISLRTFCRYSSISPLSMSLKAAARSCFTSAATAINAFLRMLASICSVEVGKRELGMFASICSVEVCRVEGEGEEGEINVCLYLQ